MALPLLNGHVPSVLSQQVREFHQAMGQGIRETPGLPSEGVLRLRALLVLEEAFEFAEAIFRRDGETPLSLRHVYEQTVFLCKNLPIVAPDFPSMVDALADTDYVVEGSRLALGVDGGPVADEVHRANMAKATGPVSLEGKRLKPPGWRAPDIVGVLHAQGWQP